MALQKHLRNAWVPVLISLLISCSRDSSNDIISLTTPLSSASDTLPSNPIGDRENPLRTHIRTYWTDGDEQSTAGLHYNHIKIYGESFTKLSNLPDGDDQAYFISDHFDMFMWGGDIVGSTAHAQYPDFLWLMEGANIPNFRASGESLQVVAWAADPTKNPDGYTWDDMVMHYKYDTDMNRFGFIPGWNPSDDPDSSGCRDSDEGDNGAPSDSNRTAECITDSEVLSYPAPSGIWRFAKVAHPGYIKYNSDQCIDFYDSHDNVDGFYFDEAAYENPSIGLEYTFSYEGLNPGASNFPMKYERPYFVPRVMVNVESQSGILISIANMVSPYYSCSSGTNQLATDAALEYLENVHNEVWMIIGGASNESLTTSKIEDYINCPLLQWMEQGKGYIFSCYDKTMSDQGKLFSLAVFYMINHQMAFYSYRTSNWMYEPGDKIEELQWNPYVEFDIGQPTVNSLDQSDFLNSTGTTRYFIWKNETNSQVLGREYERQDGQRVLVLAKIMAEGQVEGTNSTTYQLPGCYRELRPDLSLGNPTTQIALANNEGAILIQDDDGCDGSGNGKGHKEINQP